MNAPERTVSPELARSVLDSSLALRPGERLVVVTDTLTQVIGQALFEGGLQAGATAILTVIAPTGRNGAEPPEAAACAMLHADVLVCPTRYSLSHTQARHRATETGARVATMPGIHPGMFFDGPMLVEAEGPAGSRLLELLGHRPGSRSVAELGIGTNEKARITGVILEDEKAIGTIHIAFGDNSTFGGTVQAEVHIDTVIQGPTVYLDEVRVLDGGRLLI